MSTSKPPDSSRPAAWHITPMNPAGAPWPLLLLAGAGQVASAPSPIPTAAGVLAGLAALCLGAVMAFCGAHFALRRG